jgi:hypothetical protein
MPGPPVRNPMDVRRYGCRVIVQRHWWNGSTTARMRRDVYIRSDGLLWDVLVQIGGTAGRCRVHECPSSKSAQILASAWRGSGDTWREMELPAQPEPAEPVA